MDDSSPQPSGDRLLTLIHEDLYDEGRACLDTLSGADTETRKDTLQTLESVAEPATLGPVLSAVTPFLTDDERSVRLTTAKLFVTVAEADPDAVVPMVADLAARVADDGEFYYVRARSAEALGYVALDYPETVASPELLADLRIGLEFDEPEVREKLAKALAHVALGDPARLRHQVSTLADHLDDETVLVRYHLTTALVVVGCAHPEALQDGQDPLGARLDDANPFVRGRAAEALGLLARSSTDTSVPGETLSALADVDESFLAERARFAVAATGDSPATDWSGAVGDSDAIRDEIDDIAAEIATPDTDGECPHCGLSLPETGPPMCPRCGAPR